jgi:hypothetical protein
MSWPVATLYLEELKATMRGRFAWLGAGVMLLAAGGLATVGTQLLAGQGDPVMHLQGLGGTIEKSGYMDVQRFEASTPVDVVITRFSKDDERARFVAAGISGLARMPVIGQVKVAGNPACAIRYAARESSGSGDTSITLVTDRILVVGSRKTGPTGAVTIVRLTLDAKGRGGGWLCAAQTLSYDPTTTRISGACGDPNELVLQSLHQVAQGLIADVPRKPL